MTMMPPSKGASSLAQSFLNNTATQAPTLPTIQAPSFQSNRPAMPVPHGPFFSALYPGPGMTPIAPASAPEKPAVNMPNGSGGSF